MTITNKLQLIFYFYYAIIHRMLQGLQLRELRMYNNKISCITYDFLRIFNGKCVSVLQGLKFIKFRNNVLRHCTIITNNIPNCLSKL